MEKFLKGRASVVVGIGSVIGYVNEGSNTAVVTLKNAIIRNIDNLDPDSKALVEKVLDEYYMIPRITRFIEMTEKFKIWMWTAETDRGIITFEIRNHIASIKPLYDGRVLIKDANDNRYEIPDYRLLDKESQKMLIPKL